MKNPVYETAIDRIDAIIEQAEERAINAEVRLGDAKREAEEAYKGMKRARIALNELRELIDEK